MTIQNIRPGRVMLAVFLIFALSMGASLAVSTVYVLTRVMDVFNPDATPQEQEEALQQEMDAMMAEVQNGSEAITRLTLVQWSFTALITLVVTYFVVRRAATDPTQAVGYGALIGFGILLLYSLCICGTAVNMGIKLIFLALIGTAAMLGGQWAGRNLRPDTHTMPEVAAVPGLLTAPPSAPGGLAAETYYNMGVQAALGGRREEARQHFTRAVQQNPHYVEAWLQLANLADTPEQAWNYVQQARALVPGHPAVKQAVATIWPQVSANATKREPPRNQPPYPGGAQDDVQIPRTRLPGNDPASQTPQAPQATDEDAENGPLPPSAAS